MKDKIIDILEDHLEYLYGGQIIFKNEIPIIADRIASLNRNVISDAMDKLAMAVVNEKEVDVSIHVDALFKELNR